MEISIRLALFNGQIKESIDEKNSILIKLANIKPIENATFFAS